MQNLWRKDGTESSGAIEGSQNSENASEILAPKRRTEVQTIYLIREGDGKATIFCLGFDTAGDHSEVSRPS